MSLQQSSSVDYGIKAALLGTGGPSNRASSSLAGGGFLSSSPSSILRRGEVGRRSSTSFATPFEEGEVGRSGHQPTSTSSSGLLPNVGGRGSRVGERVDEERRKTRFSLSKIPQKAENGLLLPLSKPRVKGGSNGDGMLAMSRSITSPTTTAGEKPRRESVASSLRARPILTKEHPSGFLSKQRKTMLENNNNNNSRSSISNSSGAWALDTMNPPSEAYAKKHQQYIKDSRIFITKDNESSARIVQTLLPPTLHHIEPSDREVLKEDFKIMRRYDYDRLVKQNFGSLQSHAAGGPDWRSSVQGSGKIGSHMTKKPLPVLDFSYCDLHEPAELGTAKPRGGKSLGKVGKDYVEELGGGGGGGPPLDGRNTAGQPSKANALFGGKTYADNVVVIRSGNETYAFDKDEDGVKPGSKFDHLFMDIDAQQKKEDIIENRYAATHCRLSHNHFTTVGATLRLTLSQMLTTQLAVLDLSFNNLTTIGSDFLVEVKEEDDKNKDEHGNALPTKEYLYEKASQAQTAEQVTEKMRKERITGKVISRYLRRPALTTESKGGASLIFAGLSKLFLHGNKLRSPDEVFKLAPVAPSLQHLTVHGNEVVDQALADHPLMKKDLVDMFPQMVSLNFTTLSAEFHD